MLCLLSVAVVLCLLRVWLLCCVSSECGWCLSVVVVLCLLRVWLLCCVLRVWLLCCLLRVWLLCCVSSECGCCVVSQCDPAVVLCLPQCGCCVVSPQSVAHVSVWLLCCVSSECGCCVVSPQSVADVLCLFRVWLSWNRSGRARWRKPSKESWRTILRSSTTTIFSRYSIGSCDLSSGVLPPVCCRADELFLSLYFLFIYQNKIKELELLCSLKEVPLDFSDLENVVLALR